MKNEITMKNEIMMKVPEKARKTLKVYMMMVVDSAKYSERERVRNDIGTVETYVECLLDCGFINYDESEEIMHEVYETANRIYSERK